MAGCSFPLCLNLHLFQHFLNKPADHDHYKNLLFRVTGRRPIYDIYRIIYIPEYVEWASAYGQEKQQKKKWKWEKLDLQTAFEHHLQHITAAGEKLQTQKQAGSGVPPGLLV